MSTTRGTTSIPVCCRYAALQAAFGHVGLPTWFAMITAYVLYDVFIEFGLGIDATNT